MSSALPYREATCIALGAWVGLLIALPLAREPSQWPLLLVGAGLGALAGYRRRNSVAFFYFTLVAACMLSSIISFSLIEPPKP
jgi:hypothetical protein